MKIVLALAAALLVAGCGDNAGSSTPDIQPSPVASPTAVPAADGTVTTSGPVTVLDDGGGPELCLGGTLDSYPPQCGGPELVGWGWSEHDGGFETANGVRWGEFVVTGAFDGTSFTPSDVVPADEWVDEQPDGVRDFTTPCPEPEGGWRVLEAERTTRRTQEQTLRVASRLDDYAEAWVDQSINPLSDDPDGQDEEIGMNDPRLLVLNVRVTGDVAAAEAVLRETWGGALCVSQAQHTDAELRKIQMAMNDVPGVIYSEHGQDRVDVGVAHDDGSIQAWVDETYGDGMVRVSSVLVPAG
jgi:hypothetical protein